jgi:hypothetical protein
MVGSRMRNGNLHAARHQFRVGIAAPSAVKPRGATYRGLSRLMTMASTSSRHCLLQHHTQRRAHRDRLSSV